MLCRVLILLLLCAAFGSAAELNLPLNIGSKRRPSLVILSTLEGGVLGLDAATGNEVFSVRSETPALSSWAREGHPEYVPTLDGALYKIDPKTGDAVLVDARFIPADNHQTSGGDSNPVATSKPNAAGAVVLTGQSTSALSVNLRTGAVVRALSFDGGRERSVDVDNVPGGAAPGDDIVLLSRTSIGVRVMDAASMEELANATLTHTNPSFLEKGQCLIPGGSDSNARFTAAVSHDRKLIRVRDKNGRVMWERRVESAVVDAHGMGAVMVSDSPEELEAARAALPDSGADPFPLVPAMKQPNSPLDIVLRRGKMRTFVELLDDETALAKKSQAKEQQDQDRQIPANNMAIMIVFIVVICLIAGFQLGRAPRSTPINPIEQRQPSQNYGTMAPLASFDGMPGTSNADDREKSKKVRKRSKRHSKRERIAKQAEEDDDRRKRDDDIFVASNDSNTSNRSSGGVTSNRTEAGILNVGCLNVSSTVLGTGSHGTVVYEGVITPGDRKVAVKRLLRQFYDSAKHEIELLVQLDEASPYVVRYHAMEEDSEFIYVALELCAGSLADKVVDHESPAPPATYVEGPVPCVTVRALRQLLQGLCGLHKAGVVHRDLKPQNVLISRSQGGGPSDVKLADVGLATRLDGDRSSYTAISNAGGGVGTQGWRAPEVLRSGRQTKAVDVFSAGCVVYFVLTGGKHPFGNNSVTRDGNILSNEVDMKPLERLGLPEAVDIVSKMIHPDASERPTAEQALAHPFFWTDATKLAFLVDISDRLYDLRLEPIRYTENLDRSVYARKHCSEWGIHLHMELINELGREYEQTASGILRIIRNKKNHYSELSSELQRILGPLPDEEMSDEFGLHAKNFLTYFTTKMPHLLMCTYRYALDNPALIDQPHFTRYGLKATPSEEHEGDSPELHPMVRRRIELEALRNNRINSMCGPVAELQNRPHPLRPEYQRNMEDWGLYNPAARARNSMRINTNFTVQVLKREEVEETEEVQDVAPSPASGIDAAGGPPPGFETVRPASERPRIFNSASPSLRPSRAKPPLRAGPSPRGPSMEGFKRNSADVPPGFGPAMEPISLEPIYTIASVSKRRERMDRARQASGTVGTVGTPGRIGGVARVGGSGSLSGNNVGNGRAGAERHNVDFGDILAKSRNARMQ